ncbi:hypothetical protein AZE42_11606 [Rhizopogon vesiculosus]|uniref:Uncharacterized protein n=1 Tax=Rhizopogon vesiculosus TaxID=180088 RepID=A0A1J8PIU9_9AGAM|nr:hypothetical protein AZE42_11606 [Rhizopogon vesiculosus]
MLQAIKTTRRVINIFKKSTFANSHLKHAHKTHKVTRGLVSIGKTRFGTIYFAGASIQRCLTPIRGTFRHFYYSIFFGSWSAAILKKINPLTISSIRIQRTSSSGDTHASVDAKENETLARIGKFLVSQLQVEYEQKGEKIRGLDAGVALVKLNEQIIAYAKEAWPFN